MLASARASLEAYDTMRESMRLTLGDQSSLAALTERLDALTNHCLASLREAMQAMNDGDLTISIIPTTEAITAQPGAELGELATTFNATLDYTIAAIDSYNAMRARIAGM